MSEFHSEIENCINYLNDGNVILYPTDTVWGIGCDATNEKAVEKINKIKKRSDSKSYIVLLDESYKLNNYVKLVPETAWDLVDFAEKPLTIIYPDAQGLAYNVIADDQSVGIRIVKDSFCKLLIQKFKKPIVSTSANISSEQSPNSYNDISESILNEVDYIVNLPDLENKTTLPSAIIKLWVNGEINIIRK
ncbi:MAG: threonylcarbamoyl-AMP synthase [Bacteroidia bacterium]|nr:threonylcarbamoyl-AMP synthase [Bacteroidia bacterium]